MLSYKISQKVYKIDLYMIIIVKNLSKYSNIATFTVVVVSTFEFYCTKKIKMN